ncbi:MAG: ribose-phosphate pyrophosphokinase [Coriobacteriales bacterium]|jgi:ribose-phosphate pyrophosphokinase|nr:ribose-phosphate pyrophosphokinase [Coriobacteriales bacterium]
MTEVTKNLMLFSGRSNPALADKIAVELGVSLGSIKITTFSNDEIYARYQQGVRGSDLFIVQSLSSWDKGSVNDALMELLIMTDAAKRASAHTVTAVITHFGYSRQDKKSAAREPITAKLVANMLTVAGIDRVITIDLHQGQIQGFFDLPVNHLTALPLFAGYFQSRQLENLCVVSPDVGRAKAAKKLADMLGAELAIMHKSRPEHNVAEVASVIGRVKGRVCILNDDIIDTAGSICAGAQALIEEGAKEVYVCATHGIFSGPAFERLASAPLKEVVVCDTVPASAERLSQGKIQVVSVAPLLAQAINNVFNEQSVSEMFDPDFAL